MTMYDRRKDIPPTKEEHVACLKCGIKMVAQPDVYVLPMFAKEPKGAVNFSMSDHVTMKIYVCPKCHRIELFYERENER